MNKWKLLDMLLLVVLVVGLLLTIVIVVIVQDRHVQQYSNNQHYFISQYIHEYVHMVVCDFIYVCNLSISICYSVVICILYVCTYVPKYLRIWNMYICTYV